MFLGHTCFDVFMDPANFLIWNVRGLNSSARQDAVRTLVEASRADIVCLLQETKMAAISQIVMLSMLGTEFTNHVELPAIGSSGGILVAWKRSLGATGQVQVLTYCVSVQFCSDVGHPWWATCVYGPQGNEDKIQFIQELRDFRAQCHGPWMLAGDFNLICRAEDKDNSNYNRDMMGRFRRMIDDLVLKEVPLHGRNFTWSNQQASPTLVKLDRVLVTVEWEELYPNVLLQSAASHDSDHCPLLLGLKDNRAGKRRFHFEAFWPKLDGFQDAVK
jgi:exonuclease III